MNHLHRTGKYKPPKESPENLNLPKMTVKSQIFLVNTKEEQKSPPKNSKKIEQEDILDNSQGELTPRVPNPVAMLRRKPTVEDFDSIPSERSGDTPLIPLLNAHNVYKVTVRRNRSQLVVNDRSVYAMITRTLSSRDN